MSTARLTEADWHKADDAAYRLRAILRSIERGARNIAEGLPPHHDLITPVQDLALLAELGQDLSDIVHDALPTTGRGEPS